MTGYAFSNAGSVGTSFNAACTPGAVTNNIGDLLLIASTELIGANTRPVVSNWTDITLGVNFTKGSAVYATIATSTNQAMPAIPSWGNAFQAAVCLVYTGGPSSITGIVDTAHSSDRTYNSTNNLSFNATGTPSNSNSLILAISFKNTLGNASPTITETGGLVGFTRRVTSWPNANRPTIVVDELIQGAAAAITSPGATLSFTEASTQAGNSTILILNPVVAAAVPFPPMSQGGIGVQMCQ